MNHLGPLIRKIRTARGISIHELSRRAGMEKRRANISRFERVAKNSLRAPECLYPIAKALDTSVPALFMVQEVCLADPSILENKDLLIFTLEKARYAIEQLHSKKRAA